MKSKWFIRIAAAVLLLMLLAYFGAGYVVYDRLSKIGPVAPETLDNTPTNFKVTYPEYASFNPAPYYMSSYEVVSFPSRDGKVTLAGWYMETDPSAPVVIVTHGVGASKKDANLLIPAGMLFHNGFNVLMDDLRNHGDSGHDNNRTSIGNKEFEDVLGAWDWLVNVKGYKPERIGVYGVSLGAGTTLMAFGAEPRVSAAFVDSPFANLPEIMTAELAKNGFPTFLVTPAVLMARIVGGDNLLAHSPTEAISRDNGRPIFIVHGTGDERISVNQTRELISLAQQDHANLTTWIPEGVGHVGAFFVFPDEYQHKLVGFFDETLKALDQ